MALTIEKTARIAQGKMTIYFLNAKKSTITIHCSRMEASMYFASALKNNAKSGEPDPEVKFLTWNGKRLDVVLLSSKTLN